MQSINFKQSTKIKDDITPLYLSAFPEDERPPVDIFFYKGNDEAFDIIAFYEEDFVGFASLIHYKEYTYVFFLAVKDEYRGHGYGTKILSYLKKQYQNRVIILCFEEVDPKYEDYPNRIRRKQFYLKNGFIDNHLKSCEYGVIYDIFYYGDHQITFDDYINMFISIYGKIVKEIIKPV